MYLVAIMDWASRKVLSWRLSNTLDTSFCLDALEEAIYLYGKPDIFNTDQGSQFISNDFTDILKSHNIKYLWMAKDAGWIMFLLKDYGDLLNMNVYIFKNLIMFTN